MPQRSASHLLGSPPRRRGKAKERNVQLNLTRITPAWAGKSYGTDGKMPWLWDHPRVGGEKPTMLGSPQTCRGITPAWAGKRCDIKNIVRKARDHPRVGGEKKTSPHITASCQGSPPRGRGKEVLVLGSCKQKGITPAWAGKRHYFVFFFEVVEDHPRVGGEKPVQCCVQMVDCGITPAWAGKRLKRSHRSGIFISGPIPFHSVLHRPAGSGGSRAGRDGAPAGQPQNAGPA